MGKPKFKKVKNPPSQIEITLEEKKTWREAGNKTMLFSPITPQRVETHGKRQKSYYNLPPGRYLIITEKNNRHGYFLDFVILTVKANKKQFNKWRGNTSLLSQLGSQ